MKVIAMYLPQYHEIPENNRFWGKGFTDWVATKNAKPLFDGHEQPKVPLNENYYDLSDKNAILWQAQLARKYGIYGFGIYHYWFNSDVNLLTKPAEIILDNKDIDINFMFCWDNNNWKRSWSGVKRGNDWAPLYEHGKNTDNDGIMIKLDYGNLNDWEKHFNYLLKFFNDERYIKINGKPAFSIINQDIMPNILEKMFDYWDELARKNKFPGICLISKVNNRNIHIKNNEYEYEYEPIYLWEPHNMIEKIINKLHRGYCKFKKIPMFYDYDKFWKKNLSIIAGQNRKKMLNFAFVTYDDTPRRGQKGRVLLNSSPDNFYKYFKEFIKINKKQKKECVFLNAWNEWGEGNMLEPDTINRYGYLEAVRKVLQEES